MLQNPYTSTPPPLSPSPPKAPAKHAPPPTQANPTVRRSGGWMIQLANLHSASLLVLPREVDGNRVSCTTRAVGDGDAVRLLPGLFPFHPPGRASSRFSDCPSLSRPPTHFGRAFPSYVEFEEITTATGTPLRMNLEKKRGWKVGCFRIAVALKVQISFILVRQNECNNTLGEKRRYDVYILRNTRSIHISRIVTSSPTPHRDVQSRSHR